MKQTLGLSTDSETDREQLCRIVELQERVEHAAHYLPAQGPINVFIHHNTLHAFEEHSFTEGIRKGSKVFGCQPFLSEERYRDELAAGRIEIADILAVLKRDLGPSANDRVDGLETRLDLRLAMLRYPLAVAPIAELRWFVAESDALRAFRSDAPRNKCQRTTEETRRWVMRHLQLRNNRQSDHSHAPTQGVLGHVDDLLGGMNQDALDQWPQSQWVSLTLRLLWRIARAGVHGLPLAAKPTATSLRHRDLLYQASGDDSDQLINDVLIPFCGAFLDQGFASWSLPNREQGFLRSFADLYGRSARSITWMQGIDQDLASIRDGSRSATDVIYDSLSVLGIDDSELDDFLTATLLALRGWAGMIRQLELRGDRVVRPIPPGSLLEFLAVRLLLERYALSYLSRQALDYQDSLAELRHVLRRRIHSADNSPVDRRAMQVFQLAQLLGWHPQQLAGLTKALWQELVSEIEAFSPMERRQVFQLAFERHYRVAALDAVAARAKIASQPARVPRFQLITCLDEREESLRRHLEELDPACETYGAAGFFNVAMYYRGAADAHFIPLCPIVVRPRHCVEENVVYTLRESHRRRAVTRRAIGTASHHVHMGSRSVARGAILAAGVGMLATIPLVARVLFPRLADRARRMFDRFVQPPSITQLELEYSAGVPDGGERLNSQIGFTVTEMTDIAERFLRDIGLTSNFAPVVIVLGHGSSSLNNPHNSAYNCGACGGGAGGPNARALTEMLNDLRVRNVLGIRGFEIPDETMFVGGNHNTCDDRVTYFDLDRVPGNLHDEFFAIQKVIDQALERNAHERCRRFFSAPLGLTFEAAKRHVENRSVDLAQTRPECGHATNAMCVVGRRSRTRGLFMDRRSFLTSYDPTQDDSNTSILTRLLQAAVPVCAGINLEYYFSYVDNSGYGCGSKLPHNVTSLLGVMDGAASDLRTGLPWQMVEIHEPIRLLFVVETTPQKLTAIMDRVPDIGRLVRNGWVQMATLSPDSDRIHVFTDGQFVPYEAEKTELPSAASSVDWYRGWRKHLGFALVN